MIKKNILILIFLFASSIYPQKLVIPEFSLTDINFKISLKDLKDSVNTLEFQNDESKVIFIIKAKQTSIDTSIAVSKSGKYQILLNNKPLDLKHRVIPGWFSLLPPLIAIFLALAIKQVIVALAAGIFIGVFFIYDMNPFIAFLRFGDTFMLNALIDQEHMLIILFTLMIGGVVGIISRNGGTVGLANVISKFAKSARGGMISSWVMGVSIFFDDYANSLIIGNMMRPITDKYKISREKLSYIVDATAAPVASLFIISTWIGYQVGLIQEAVNSIGINKNGYDLFISAIPYSFYSIATLFFVFLIVYTQKDFGSMLIAERRARETGRLSNNNDVDNNEFGESIQNYFSKQPRFLNGAIPILIILFGTLAGLYFTGRNSLEEAGVKNYSLSDIIGNSDAFRSLLWASIASAFIAILMSISQKILSLEESFKAWQKGVQTMLAAVIILVFAWAISNVTSEMKTADFIISVISEKIHPGFLPAIIFLICALTSFATGTSWGIMAIVMPIAIPLTYNISNINHLDSFLAHQIMVGVIASVLSGSVFGDHCSPIADTTILSSLASKCNHIDHVKTQMPYAITVGITTLLLGYLPIGFGFNPFISLLIISLVIFLIIKYVAKKI